MPPCPDEYLPTRPMTIPQIINHCLELLHRHSDPSGEKDLIQRYVRFLLSGRYIDDEENQHRVFLSHPAAQLETIRLQAFYTGVHGQSRFFPTIEEIVLFPIDLGTRMEKDVGYVVIDLPAGSRGPATQLPISDIPRISIGNFSGFNHEAYSFLCFPELRRKDGQVRITYADRVALYDQCILPALYHCAATGVEDLPQSLNETKTMRQTDLDRLGGTFLTLASAQIGKFTDYLGALLDERPHFEHWFIFHDIRFKNCLVHDPTSSNDRLREWSRLTSEIDWPVDADNWKATISYRFGEPGSATFIQRGGLQYFLQSIEPQIPMQNIEQWLDRRGTLRHCQNFSDAVSFDMQNKIIVQALGCIEGLSCQWEANETCLDTFTFVPHDLLPDRIESTQQTLQGLIQALQDSAVQNRSISTVVSISVRISNATSVFPGKGDNEYVKCIEANQWWSLLYYRMNAVLYAFDRLMSSPPWFRATPESLTLGLSLTCLANATFDHCNYYEAPWRGSLLTKTSVHWAGENVGEDQLEDRFERRAEEPLIYERGMYFISDYQEEYVPCHATDDKEITLPAPHVPTIRLLTHNELAKAYNQDSWSILERRFGILDQEAESGRRPGNRSNRGATTVYLYLWNTINDPPIAFDVSSRLKISLDTRPSLSSLVDYPYNQAASSQRGILKLINHESIQETLNHIILQFVHDVVERVPRTPTGHSYSTFSPDEARNVRVSLMSEKELPLSAATLTLVSEKVWHSIIMRLFPNPTGNHPVASSSTVLGQCSYYVAWIRTLNGIHDPEEKKRVANAVHKIVAEFDWLPHGEKDRLWKGVSSHTSRNSRTFPEESSKSTPWIAVNPWRYSVSDLNTWKLLGSSEAFFRVL